MKLLNYYNKSMNIQIKSLGENHPSLAITYNNIGSVYYNKSDYDEALNYYNKCRDIQIKSLGENHPLTKITKKNLDLLILKIKIKQLLLFKLNTNREY